MSYVPCPECPLRRKPLFRRFTQGELSWVAALKQEQLHVPARDDILRAAQPSDFIYTILTGWAYRYKTLGYGRRQILDFLLPGDLVGLQSPFIGITRHAVCTLTEVELCQFPGNSFRAIFVDQPALSGALVETLLREEDRADTRLLLLGRQRPAERLAYLILELHDRLSQRDMVEGDRCWFPLTYELMADALGLSRAQLARSLTSLRERGWLSLGTGVLEIQDRSSMVRFCGYDYRAGTQRMLI